MPDPAAAPATDESAVETLGANVAIANVIEAIAAAGREPDEWEASAILGAIGAIIGGLKAQSAALANRSLLLADARDLDWLRNADTPTNAQLRLALLNGVRSTVGAGH